MAGLCQVAREERRQILASQQVGGSVRPPFRSWQLPRAAIAWILLSLTSIGNIRVEVWFRAFIRVGQGKGVSPIPDGFGQ